MVTNQQWSAVAKIIGNALLDVAAELEDERELPPEPDLQSPVAQMPAVPALARIGPGGDGPNRLIPECPVCFARGGGGHGGCCPNSGRSPNLWTHVPPLEYQQPDRPQGRVPW